MSDDDLSERLRAVEQDNARLRALLERRGSTAGLRHQIRNTLAMVRSVVRQTIEQFEGTDEFAAHLDGRIDAVLRIQNTIAGSPVDGVPLDLLVMDEAVAQTVGEQLSIDGPDVLIRPAAAGLLALAIHELAVNAIKFGAPTTAMERIAVNWSIGDEDVADRLTIIWIEHGSHDRAQAARHRGFGSDVIENALRYQLGGEGAVSFEPSGLRCTIRLPPTAWTTKS